MQRFLFELFILIVKSIECKISTRAFFVSFFSLEDLRSK